MERIVIEAVNRTRAHCLVKLKLGGVALNEKAEALATAYLEANPAPEDPRSDEVPDIRHEVHVGAVDFAPSFAGQKIELIIESLRSEHDASGWDVGHWDRAKRVADWLREEPERVAEALGAFVAEEDLPEGVVNGIFWALDSLKSDQVEQFDIAEAIDLVTQHHNRLIEPNPVTVANWLKNLASWPIARVSDERFLGLWDRVMEHDPPGAAPTVERATLDDAINDLGGKLAEALHEWFWRTKPRAREELSKDFRSRLEGLIGNESLTGLHARCVCMQALHALFTVDPAWTKAHLLPRLRWDGAATEQARWHWQAHLIYGRFSLDLAEAYRDDFLRALAELTEADSEAFRAACERFAVLAAIHDYFRGRKEEADKVFHHMGPTGGAVVLETLRYLLQESEQPAEMWRKSIGPWLRDNWPYGVQFSDEPIPEQTAELVLETDNSFAEAFRWADVRRLLKPIPDRYGILWRLTADEPANRRQTELPSRFPAEMARFLLQVLGEKPTLNQSERSRLQQLLAAIESSPNYDHAESTPFAKRLRTL